MFATARFQSVLKRLVLPLILMAMACMVPPVQAAETEPYSHAELSQMLAPIALYPDVVLAQVLMAATYPIEVIEADRWLKRNTDLEGRELDEALLEQDWDPSVKELCHLPSIMALMSERIGETTELGNAFLAQETEVMDVVQELRSRAYERGRLSNSKQHRVVVTDTLIVIEPVDPQVIYVPYYDPCDVFAPWWYPPCPSYYWRPSGVSIRVGIAYWPGFYFSYTFGTWSYFDWHRHVIHIEGHRRPRFVRHERWESTSGGWLHRPEHRRGVAYRDLPTTRKFQQAPSQAEEIRRDLRRPPQDQRRDRENLDRSRQRQERGGFVAEPPEQGRQERQQRDGKQQEQKQIRTEQQKPDKGEKVRKAPPRSKGLEKQEQNKKDDKQERGRKIENPERNRQELDRQQKQKEQEREQRRELEEQRKEHRSPQGDGWDPRRYYDEDSPDDKGRGGWSR